ncbi:MAG: hypothetical protein HY812_20415 [Planctomycetes bacterium]|nr:hypothetical protein [Planctomycetota bacterium]
MNERSQSDDLEARLKEAWRQAPRAAVPAGWQAGVMRAIRARAGAGLADPRLHALHRTIFRGVAAAAAMALIAAGFALRGDASAETELLRLLALDPQALLELVLVF